ncbi:hypothetical protein DY023_11805 [Microbacterium bovistercoris]|uniref:Secreted protein n=1 Tax=Microbacterium bovistercoris TaxID=2293570 RepID=A0A371NRZ7_9MICO|nr:hypothetical protein [Microbacterium bovistercoris]REJ04934.1 hypothetical protein DY023_11805 [Microbacterium bovistercoris]
MTVVPETGVSRRTLVKGAAWAVPALAVATAAPLAAASDPTPQPPVFDVSDGCATTGNGTGCAGGNKTPQVPFTVTNTTTDTLYLQVLGSQSWIAGKPRPTSWSSARVFEDNGTQNDCSPEYTETRCGGYISVAVAAGETASLWLVGTQLGSAGAFHMAIEYRWVEADCTVVVPTAQVTSGLISSSNNCA